MDIEVESVLISRLKKQGAHMLHQSPGVAITVGMHTRAGISLRQAWTAVSALSGLISMA